MFVSQQIYNNFYSLVANFKFASADFIIVKNKRKFHNQKCIVECYVTLKHKCLLVIIPDYHIFDYKKSTVYENHILFLSEENISNKVVRMTTTWV